MRHLAGLLPSSSSPDAPNPPIILNCLTPGLCHSSLGRSVKGMQYYIFTLMKSLIARSTEVGSRTLVAAAAAGDETVGQYMSDCHVVTRSPLVESEEGIEVGRKLWNELQAKLEGIKPGVVREAGLQR